MGKKVQVTEAGNLLLQYAEREFHDLKKAEMALREISALEELVFVLNDDHPLARNSTLAPADICRCVSFCSRSTPRCKTLIDLYFARSDSPVSRWR